MEGISGSFRGVSRNPRELPMWILGMFQKRTLAFQKNSGGFRKNFRGVEKRCGEHSRKFHDVFMAFQRSSRWLQGISGGFERCLRRQGCSILQDVRRKIPGLFQGGLKTFQDYSGFYQKSFKTLLVVLRNFRLF